MGACLQAGQQGGRGAGPQERVAGEEVEHAESEGGECVRVFVSFPFSIDSFSLPVIHEDDFICTRGETVLPGRDSVKERNPGALARILVLWRVCTF